LVRHPRWVVRDPFTCHRRTIVGFQVMTRKPKLMAGPKTGSGRTFCRVHLITAKRCEFRCAWMRVRPDPIDLARLQPADLIFSQKGK
jgi:hypothetical protein